MKKKTEKAPVTRRRRQVSTVADWEGIDSDIIRKIVSTIALGGGAVRFGYSRDGGAYSVGIYGDGKPYTEFHPADDGVTEWLQGFIDDFE